MQLQSVPIANDGAVLRHTVVACLESQEFIFRKVHLEFCCELSSSTDSLSSQYSPQFYTALDCFFKHARGEFQLNIKIF